MYVCIIRSYLEMLQSRRRRRHPPTTTAAPRSDRMPTDQRLTGAGGSGELQRRSLAEKKEVEEVERGSAACPCPASCAYLGLGSCCWCCNCHISARWVGGRWPEMGGVVCISERASSSYVCVCVCAWRENSLPRFAYNYVCYITNCILGEILMFRSTKRRLQEGDKGGSAT